MAQVDDAELRPGLALYRPLPTLLRLDVLPFGMLYATFSACAASAQRGHGFAVGLALVACMHALAFFASEWSLRVKCFVAYSRISIAGLSLYDDVVVKVKPTSPSLPVELCPIQREAPSPKLQVQKATIPVPTLWFAYQKLRFCLDTSLTAPVCFCRLTYPVANTLAAYAGANGYTSRIALEAAGLRWQKNEFEIPMPAFWTLLKQHLVAPFFVFQFFCMLLWCMDEYMYYSLLTMVMLVLFECTVVKQRQHNLELLSLMQRPPTRVYAYRMTKWQSISSIDLVPGDLVSVGRTASLAEPDDTENSLVAPCDLLLLRGACVVNEAMLSGESIPLRKDHVDPLESSALLMDGRHRRHVLFGGTKILQHTPYVQGESDALPAPPDLGCVAYVLRTGFGTTQGNMLRTMLLASPHVSANNAESLCFILFLLCFAVAASLYVLLEGAGDPTRSSYKLFLHCVMIITSVVPPELPMELSLAVTNSLLSLSRMEIFCTEPFKIPVAGKVDVVCVDKTGTLTTDALSLRGVAGLTASSLLPIADPRTLVSPGSLPMDVQIVLASCHALMVLNGAIAGDPLEKTVLSHLRDWTLHQLDRVTSRYPFSVRSLRIVHRFGFSSELRRMSALVLVDDGSAVGHARVVSKGAPEVMEPLFANVPSYYKDVHEHYARKGARVLALGFKRVPISDLARTRHLARDATETHLTFAGFLVLDCPLKPDSRRVVQDLQLANHRVVMVTGDSALTACDVARQVHLLPHAETLVLEPSPTGLSWTSGAEKLPFSDATLATLAETHNFCVLGSAVASLSPTSLQALAPLTQVFARTSPDEKAGVLAAMNASQSVTAMCGDGTNDVGALKMAHVGISLVNGPTHRRHHTRDAPPLGDASIASPFTSRGESLQCVVDVIRQGRCTLVTSLQMYKILGVNCLVSAYVLSALYVYGVKQGETQLTCSGLLVALCFLFLSYAKPATTLSHERPVSRVFCVSVLSSILLQFGVHLCSLVLGLSIAAPLVEWNDPRLHADANFTPNALNTLMFLLATCMQVTTFVANYKGCPFMESFREHKLLARCAYASYAFVLVTLLELWPAMNTWLELVPLGSHTVQAQVLCLMLFDTIAVLALERTVQVLTTAYPEWMT